MCRKMQLNWFGNTCLENEPVLIKLFTRNASKRNSFSCGNCKVIH